MTMPGLHDKGRVVARSCAAGSSLAGFRRMVLFAVAASALVGTASCSSGGQTASASAADSPDAAIAFTSQVVTNPASWTSLWGSWPGPRYDHGMAYDADLKRMVVFGGREAASGPHYGDLWEWDTMKGAWNQRTPGTRTPYDRSGQGMVYDTVRKRTFMFSGWQPGAGFYHPDQWEWDGMAGTWAERAVSLQPSPRYGAAMVWDSTRNKAVLFGGFDEAMGRRNDTWEWDGTAWTERTPATKPTPRYNAMIAYDAGRGKTVLYSGNTGTGVATGGTWVDELWEWDGAAGTWTKVTLTALSSYQHYYGYARLTYDAGRSKVVMYYDTNNVWEYNPATTTTPTPSWTAFTPTRAATTTPPYTVPAFVYDSGRQRMVIFGGYYGARRELWELNGADYSLENRSVPLNGPIQRQFPAIAFDSDNGKMMVFGGRSTVDNLYKQDIYEWSGADGMLKNQTTGGTKPPGRNQAGLCYDSKRKRLLLFGGYGADYYDDLWSWDPTTREWAQITFTGARPSARYGVWMFYDAVRDKAYVFGQNNSGYQNWEYDPAANTWKDRTVVQPPTGLARSSFDVSFDSHRGKIVMLGGYYNGVYNTDIWEWDTTTGVWAQNMPAATTTLPNGRYNHTIAYDSIRRVMLLVGGYINVTGFSGASNDSWEFDANLGTWTETTPPLIKPLPRSQHLMVFDSKRGTTNLFGGTVPADSTYGPQEIWEYVPNAAKRPHGSGCSAATAASCVSGNCVDGVCCEQTAAQCNGTCRACNVSGNVGKCADVPVGVSDDTCASDQVCDAAHICKLPNGRVCSSYTQCASGSCTDGVCCNTACTEACKVCNLAAQRGTCANVPQGNEDPGTCSSDIVQPRFCDGGGVCTNGQKAQGKPCTASGQCASTYCIDGFCCNTPCNGTCSSCGQAGYEGSCRAIPVGLPDHSATVPCDGPMQYCSGSTSCAMNKKPNGGACTAATDCGSNYCVDGFCCNSACVGTCQACNVAGRVGSCVNVSPGTQDTMATVTCAGTQYCDAAGTCQSGLKPNATTCAANTECGSGNCIDGVCCDSACGAACYACNLPGTIGMCVGVSTGGTDGAACVAPNYCTAAHACTAGKKPNGAVCATDLECGSNSCVDKTCCETSCVGTCRSCANATGTCQTVAAGMDPRMDCKGQLGCGGTCNGSGACQYAPQGKGCRQAGCQPDIGLITGAGMCDGAGNCDATPTKECGGFGCFTDTANMAQCKTDCKADPDCALRRYCLDPSDGGTSGDAGGVSGDAGSGTQCPPVFDLGHACSRNAQCGSGACSDGVCCNINCDKCGSCNLVGTVGTCVPVPAGTDPNDDCIDSASDPTGKCGGMCDGHARCVFPAAGSTCGTCKSCSGTGLCNVMPEDDETCQTIDCDGLNTSCMDYQDVTAKRCGSLGACKAPNTVATCSVVTNMCGGDGGSTDGAVDAGPPPGGGGGCGCDLGGGTSAGPLASLLILAGVVSARRRRRA